MPALVVFTDLDGTLLDARTFNVRPALPALDALRRRAVPVVPVTSKTAPEVRLWMRQLLQAGPFACENGGAVHAPRGYFPGGIQGGREEGDEVVLTLGGEVAGARRTLADLSRELGVPLRGYGEMSPDEVASRTGLKGDEVRLSMLREFEEPFLVEGPCDEGALRRAGEARGYEVTRGGRFFHIARGCSKGRAVGVLAGLFRRLDPAVVTAAVGDSPTDLGMLRAVDLAYLVERAGGGHDPAVPLDAARRVEGIGPLGWRRAVERLLASDFESFRAVRAAGAGERP